MRREGLGINVGLGEIEFREWQQISWQASHSPTLLLHWWGQQQNSGISLKLLQTPVVVLLLRWNGAGHRTGGSLTGWDNCGLFLNSYKSAGVRSRAQQHQGQGWNGMAYAWRRVMGDKIQRWVQFCRQVGYSLVLVSASSKIVMYTAFI